MQMSVKDVARIFNVSKETIYHWIENRKMPFNKIQDHYVVNRIDILEWATTNGIKVPHNLFEDEGNDPAELPSVLETLKAGGIFYDVGGTDIPTVLKNVVQLLKLDKTIDRDFLYQVLLSRESQGSTGIGDGIAIPHARNPLILGIRKPCIQLCFLQNPIDFKAIDNKPVNILFTIISPSVKIHLHLLSRLASKLLNPEWSAALQKRLPEKDILDIMEKLELGK